MTRTRLAKPAALLAVGSIALTAGCGSTAGTTSTSASAAAKPVDAKSMTMVTVVKLTGVGWFDRMNQGIKAFGQRTGVDARMDGADTASPEKQIAIIQNLIAQKPTAITVVPNSPTATESVLKSAREQGIVVVTHEAPGMTNVDADLEAFDNADYGAAIMDAMASCMGKSGKYVQFVGALTAETHLAWVKGAYEKGKSAYPGMTRISDPIESKEDENTAYARAKELLTRDPEIKGFQGSAATDIAGIARAVQETGRAADTCVIGTSIPSIAGKYLTDKSIDQIFFWDPAAAGEAQLALALKIAKGEKITEGTDLGVDGYHKLKKSPTMANVWLGDAQVSVDASTASKYPF